MTTLLTPRKTLKPITTASEWWYFGRNFSHPKWDTIAMRPMAGQGQFALATDVFAAMQLSITELRTIYSSGDSAENMCCHHDDHEAWSRLAQLTKKTIHWVHCHGDPEGTERWIYYPDGRFNEA